MHWYDLTNLLPPVFRNIKSMFAAADSENTELLKIQVISGKISENFYIQTCDNATLQYWESLLNIQIFDGETTEERREDILRHLTNNQPITEPYVKQVLTDTFGAGNYEIYHTPDNNLEVHISVYDADSYDKVDSFFRWFSVVCPAHILWFFENVSRADSDVYVYGHAESDVGSVATMSINSGTAVLYYGPTSVIVDTLEL